jgi:hypothetical protein
LIENLKSTIKEVFKANLIIFLEKNSYAVEASSALSVQILPCTIISKTYGIIALMFQDRNVFLSFVPRSSFSRRKPYLA